jgi:hypothetical protein
MVLVLNEEQINRLMTPPNPPSNVVIRTEISGLWSIPDHQGIRCKPPRRDD